ncbi:unnamed protein product [Dovyalis caffra]|uniref:Uncharacterized protein n=1 Tax=Dovyalis caffra TaxID=77055 RepID=A0AAV1SEM9_9ROSI|nr:unnamed protein product [Dovyalis caffra]
MLESVQLLDCGIPVHGRYLPDLMQDGKDDACKLLLHHAKRHSLAEGILLNSFIDLEADTIKAMQDEEIGKIPLIYPVGPIIQSGSTSGINRSECLNWLDDQPKGSVLYVSFGSAKSSTFLFIFFPKRFLDRNKDQGLVVPSWAPQIHVLSHSSTGGFLTHCDCNSTPESIVAWPLHAEQKMNAVLLSERFN